MVVFYAVTWKIQDGVLNGCIIYLNMVSISMSRSNKKYLMKRANCTAVFLFYQLTKKGKIVL